jgi:hypothetical protein
MDKYSISAATWPEPFLSMGTLSQAACDKVANNAIPAMSFLNMFSFFC